MRIMYYPQISMRSYRNNDWLLDSASQLVRMTAMAKALDEHTDIILWKYVLPKVDQCRSDTFPGSDMSNITAHRIDWAYNAAMSRHTFDPEAFRGMLEEFEPDIIINEQPEHTLAFKHMAEVWCEKKPKIISSYVHVPWYEDGWNYPRWDVLKQQSGFSADAIIFQNRLEEERFKRACFRHDAIGNPKTYVWTWLIDSDHFTTKERRYGHTRFAYAGRVTDVKRTSWDHINQAWRDFKPDTPCSLTVFDPNESMINLGTPNAEVFQARNREEYLETLQDIDVVISLNPTVSIGMAEAVASGCLVISLPQKHTSMDLCDLTMETTKEDLLEALAKADELVQNGDVNRSEISDRAKKMWSADEEVTMVHALLRSLVPYVK